MKTLIYILTLSLLLISCDYRQKNFQEQLNDVRQDFSENAEAYNARVLKSGKVIDSIYNIADTNTALAINRIDDILLRDTSLDSQALFNLHFVKGDIYYRVDSSQKALEEFSSYPLTQSFTASKVFAAKAGALIKLKNYDSAISDLTRAASVNYDYDWNIGNFYEVIKQKDSAISFYQRLYQRDTLIYKDCKERIVELSKAKPKYFTELHYRDRQRVTLIMNDIK